MRFVAQDCRLRYTTISVQPSWQTSDISAWVCFQVLIAIGTGMVLNTLLPAVQAAQPESDQATATATWAFTRSFGCIWGATIPAAIFINRLEKSLGRISDSTIRSELSGGQAYGRTTHEYISQFQDPTRSQVIGCSVDALKFTSYISLAFSGMAFLLVLVEKDIPLRTELRTDYGLEDVELVNKHTVA
jgi:hypothetical protein